MSFLKHIRIFPFFLLTFAALLTVKVAEIIGYATSNESPVFFISDLNAKPAEGEAATPPPEGTKPDAKSEAKPEEKKEAKPEAKEAKSESKEGKPAEKAEGKDGKSEKPAEVAAAPKPEPKKEYSPVELDLLQNLSKRREELDKWDAEITLRENVLKATAQKVDAKIKELGDLKVEVSKLLEEYNQKDDMKIASLVKIYENMKPKDAAAIFGQLDMPILLEVVAKMKEVKVAPILAQMDPARAKELTMELANQKRLPDVSSVAP